MCTICACRFADTDVRSVAVSWIEKSSDDELVGYLPQLVQVQIKYTHRYKFYLHFLNNAVLCISVSFMTHSHICSSSQADTPPFT